MGRRGSWQRRRRFTRVFRRHVVHRINEDADYTTFAALTGRCGAGLGRGLGSGRLLLALTVVAIVSGAVLGLAFASHFGVSPVPVEHQFLEFPGKLFLRMLKMLTVPLVISSNVSSAATITSKATRRLGVLALLFYLTTTAAAVSIGAALALLVRPGSYNSRMEAMELGVATLDAKQAMFSIMDLVRNLVPENLVEATFQRSRTNYHQSASTRNVSADGISGAEGISEVVNILASQSINATLMSLAPGDGNQTSELPSKEEIISTVIDNLEVATEGMVSGANILGLICFSLFFGLGLRKVQEVDGVDVTSVLHFFTGLRKIMVYLVSIIIWFSPIGILSLIAAEVSRTSNIGQSLRELAMYTLTVCGGLALHVLLVLGPATLFLARKNPLRFLYDMFQALMVATGTASSLATLPATAACLENNVRLDLRVMRFMLPMGTTINMDGTALYQIVAIIYLAQGIHMELDGITVGYMMVLTLISSIITASVPSGGVLSMMITMQAMGMPTGHIDFVLAIDWLLDRFRTPVNVLSNAVGIAVVAERCKNSLHSFEAKMQKNDEILTEESEESEEKSLDGESLHTTFDVGPIPPPRSKNEKHHVINIEEEDKGLSNAVLQYISVTTFDVAKDTDTNSTEACSSHSRVYNSHSDSSDSVSDKS